MPRYWLEELTRLVGPDLRFDKRDRIRRFLVSRTPFAKAGPVELAEIKYRAESPTASRRAVAGTDRLLRRSQYL